MIREEYPVIHLVGSMPMRAEAHGLMGFGASGGIPADEEEIRLAVEWLTRRCKPIKTPRHNSYVVKHCCERWAGRYVSNGAMIIAAERCGFRQRRLRNGVNTEIGIDTRRLIRLPESDPNYQRSLDFAGIGLSDAPEGDR
ncbi:hypothetical protein [Crateriforma spongiae]|uniref:hypothetical protein n=1 Tax=Crateriforma spongiae TaxID=2724528 RepID=UPI001447CC4C|nr:hypothetical protein [Crateriforma spongiae]